MKVLKIAGAWLVFFFLATDTTCGQTLWTAGTGDWFDNNNWSLDVPNSASGTSFDAIIANGGTSQLQAPGGSVRRLRVGLVGGPGSLLVNGGTLNVTDDLHLNEGSAGPASMTVQGGSTVTAIDTVVGFSSAFSTSFLISGADTVYNATTSFIVGQSGAGLATLTVNDGAVLASGTSTIASNGFGNATVDGAGSRWSSTGIFTVGSVGTGTLTIQNQGVVHVGTALSINGTSSVNLNGGTLRFNTGTGLNRITYNSGTFQLAGNRTLDTDSTITYFYGGFVAPPASISIPTGKALTVEGNSSQFQNNRTVTINGGSLSSTNHTIGTLLNGGGFLVVNGGGTMTTTANATLGDVSGSFGNATVTGAGSSWTVGNSLTLGVGTGNLVVENQALVHVGSVLSISNVSTVFLNGGTLRFNTVAGLSRLIYASGTIQLAGDRSVGSDFIITGLYGDLPTVPTGKGLTVEGTVTLTKPLTIDGGAFKTASLAVGAGGSLNFDHGILELAGGSVTGLANLIVPGNGEFRASGAAATRVTAAAGSTITTTGDLTLGDAALPNGFYSNGDVVVGPNAVTLADANDAVLDSAALVTLGSGGNPGTLAAANGLTLNFGGNITGHGTIDTLNDPAKPFINNGNLTGSSLAQPLTLAGYVKGVGTYDNVEFAGTFSPGFSPAKVNLGSASYNGTLEIEIGGLAPGSSGYDQLNHILGDGIAQLGGTLDVSLLGGFEPEVGNSFEVLTAVGGVVGTFADVALPSLEAGLSWSLLYEPNAVLLEVIDIVNGDFDGDGDIDGRDFLAWQRGESPDPFSAGDLAEWKANYGPGPLAASVAVPEPKSSLLLAGLLLLVRARVFQPA